MFEDKRSKKVILVAHCVLNQNAKIDRCAHYPGAMKEVVHILVDAGVGIIQMPCPELGYLGLDRQLDRGVLSTVESEDSRVAERMMENQGNARCHAIATDLVYQVEEYRKHGFAVVGIVGINGSPTCGVETTWAKNREEQGAGIFVQILDEECHRKNISLPLRGIKAHEPQKAIAAVLELLGNAFLNEFTAWASVQSDMHAVALVGSYARNAATSTSDIDLVVITNCPDNYLRDLGWTRQFGQVRRQQIEDYGKLISVRVWYADGREVEYGIADESWAAVPLDAGTRRVISDGIRVLFEREPLLRGLEIRD